MMDNSSKLLCWIKEGYMEVHLYAIILSLQILAINPYKGGIFTIPPKG
jgi:hypothetical protein